MANSQILSPIRRGVFAEDPESFLARAQQRFDEAEPRDALESDLVQQIHMVIVRLERAQRVEAVQAEAVGTDRRLGDPNQLAGLGFNVLSDAHMYGAGLLVAYLAAPTDYTAGDHDYEWMAHCIDAVQGHRQVRGLWTDEREPENEAEWRRVVDALVAHHWDSRDQARAWITHQIDQTDCYSRDQQDEFLRTSTDRLLDTTTRWARVQGQLISQLHQLLTLWTELRARPFPDPTGEKTNP